MKRLFDQNLLYRLVRALADAYPDCQHVRNVGLGEASDTQVWAYAQKVVLQRIVARLTWAGVQETACFDLCS